MAGVDSVASAANDLELKLSLLEKKINEASLFSMNIFSEDLEEATTMLINRANVNDDGKLFVSPLEDVPIARVPLSTFVQEHWEDYGNDPAFVDAGSGAARGYGALQTSINVVRTNLHQRGFRPKDVMLVLASNHAEGAPNPADFAVVYHAVLTLGGVVTTCNPAYQPEQIAHQLKDSQATFACTAGAGLDTLKMAVQLASGVHSIFVFDQVPRSRVFCKHLKAVLPFAALARAPPGPLQPPFPVLAHDSTAVAVIAYSAGTTGPPKGAVLSHQNLVANLHQFTCPDMLRYGREDVVLCALPLCELLTQAVVLHAALRQGARLVVGGSPELLETCRLIEQYGVTILPLAPPTLLLLAKAPAAVSFDLSSLRLVVCGGAPLGEEAAAAFVARFPRVQLRQAYGMVETSPITHVSISSATAATATTAVTAATAGGPKLASVGVLLPNTTAKIVDARSNEALGPNAVGELWVRGPQVTSGYQHTLAAPSYGRDDEGFLPTGDLCYFDDDGCMYVVNRVKDMIEYMDFQVPPAEVEAVLRGHPHVLAAAVVGAQDAEAGEVPQAFVVKSAHAWVPAEELLDYVAARVPDHQRLRGGVIFVESIPTSESGKVLRRLLRK